MFFQFGIIWVFVLHASEIDGLVFWGGEVVGVCEGVSLYLLSHLLQELVVDGL